MRMGVAGRWILGLAGALLAAVFLGFAAAAWYVSSNAFRDQLIALAEAQTGRDVVVNGRLHLSFWPVVGVSAEQASLANAPGGEAVYLLTAKEVDAGFDLMSLLRGHIVIRRIRLEEPVLNLEVDEEGRGNWILSPSRGQQPDPPQQTRAPPRDLRIDAFSIAGGRVSLLDRRSNRTFAVADLTLAAQLSGLDQPASVEASFAYREEPMRVAAVIGTPRTLRTGAPTSLSFEADSRFLTIGFEGEASAADGALRGATTASGPSVRALVRWLGYPFPEGAGLERFNLEGALTAAPAQLRFENATLEVDAILARGDLVFETAAQRPFVTGRLALGPLDLNRYLNPRPVAGVASGETVAAPAALDIAAPSWGRDPIRLEILRSLNANLELTTQEVRFFRSKLDRMGLTMTLNEGFLAATLHDLTLYGGAGVGRVEMDARTDSLRMTHDVSLDGVAVRTFLGDMLGFTQLEGSGQVRLALSASGRTQSELVSSLYGRAAFVLNQGAMRGVDIGGLSETIGAALRNELIEPDARTAFNSLSMSFEAAEGRFATQDFQLGLERMRVGMVGVIDLAQRRVDLRFTPRARAIATPFVVRGPFDALAFRSDLRGRARSEIEGMAREVAASSP